MAIISLYSMKQFTSYNYYKGAIMKTTKLLTVSLPIEFCTRLKRMSLKRSLKTNLTITVSSLVKKAIIECYGFKEGEEEECTKSQS